MSPGGGSPRFDRSRAAMGYRRARRGCMIFNLLDALDHALARAADRVGGADSNRKGCDLRHPCWPDCSFPFHLAFGAEAFWVLLALSEETR